jgi:hypothetical protein
MLLPLFRGDGGVVQGLGSDLRGAMALMESGRCDDGLFRGQGDARDAEGEGEWGRWWFVLLCQNRLDANKLGPAHQQEGRRIPEGVWGRRKSVTERVEPGRGSSVWLFCFSTLFFSSGGRTGSGCGGPIRRSIQPRSWGFGKVYVPWPKASKLWHAI